MQFDIFLVTRSGIVKVVVGKEAKLRSLILNSVYTLFVGLIFIFRTRIRIAILFLDPMI